MVIVFLLHHDIHRMDLRSNDNLYIDLLIKMCAVKNLSFDKNFSKTYLVQCHRKYFDLPYVLKFAMIVNIFYSIHRLPLFFPLVFCPLFLLWLLLLMCRLSILLNHNLFLILVKYLIRKFLNFRTGIFFSLFSFSFCVFSKSSAYES